MARKTRFAGLTALDAGESIYADGGAFTSRNPDITDLYLEIGSRLHRHDGSPALSNPTNLPVVTVYDTGGALPAETTILVGYTLLDDKGGETEISPVAMVTTPSGISAVPNEPLAEIDYASGTLTIGTYYYAVTLVDGGGGETNASPLASVTREPGTPGATIVISDLAAVVSDNPGAVRYRLYRAKDQGKLLLLSEGIEDVIVDDGSLECDCCIEPPSTNTSTTGQTSALAVVVNDIGDAAGWRLYVTDDGEFYSPSLYGPPRTPAEVGQQIVISSLALDQGAPPDVSTTVAGAAKINPDTDLLNWHWKQPVPTASDLPEDSDTAIGDVRMSTDDGVIYRYLIDGWAPLTVAAAHFMPPVADVASLPTAGNTDGDLRLVLEDFSLHAWSFSGNAWQAVGGSSDGGGDGGGGDGGHTIFDELAPLTQRPNLSFRGAGVSVSDNGSDTTVVTIPGAVGGGGGGTIESLEVGQAVQWVNPVGVTVGELALNQAFQSQSLYAVDGSQLADVDPLPLWAIPNTGGAGRVTVAGGAICFPGAPADTVLFPSRNSSGFDTPNGTTSTSYELVDAGWRVVGVGWIINADPAFGLTVSIANTGAVRVEYREQGGPAAWAVLDSVNVAVPSVGDIVQVWMDIQGAALTFMVRNITTDVELVYKTIETPENWVTDQTYPTGGYPAMRVMFTSPDSVRVRDTYSDFYTSYYELVATIDGSPFALASMAPAPAPVGIAMEPDWQQSFGHDADGFHGRVSKIAGAAPAAGELIATLSNYYGGVHDVPVVTGDSDGRELGFVVFGEDPVDGNLIQLLWGDGRSSDPATKEPWVSLEGVR